MDGNRKAFLDVIAHSEIGAAMLSQSNNGYNVIVGSKPGSMIRFTDYSRHPRRAVWFPKLRNPSTGKMGLWSTAAGRYQFNWPTWSEMALRMGKYDFMPETQDAFAIEKIRQRGALLDVDLGRIEAAVFKCRKEWASLPGSDYGQRENPMAGLQEVFVNSGGRLSA